LYGRGGGHPGAVGSAGSHDIAETLAPADGLAGKKHGLTGGAKPVDLTTKIIEPSSIAKLPLLPARAAAVFKDDAADLSRGRRGHWH
jgi:hypothetical protein